MKNKFNLENKVAIITGGGSGLGRSMSKALALAGAKVVIADINIENARKVSNEILESGGQSFSIKANIINKKDLNSMVEETVKIFKKIDVLVNSAGIDFKGNDSLLEVKEKDWDCVIDVNLKGTFLSNQIVARQMIKQKKGKIINIASISGLIINRNVKNMYGFGAYCASKAGVILFTKALALELIKYNINVNCISPGYMKTPLVIENWENDPVGYEDRIKMTPIGRPGEPEELSGLVIYLASDSSSYMTGNNIIIDGGYTCW